MKKKQNSLVSALRPYRLVLVLAAIVALRPVYCASQILPPSYPRLADLGVNGIFLYDRQSAENVLGKELALKEDEDGGGCLTCFNRDKNEMLTICRCRDCQGGIFQGFKVSASLPYKLAELKCHLKEAEYFFSFRKIRLGMALKEVTDIFGDDFKAQSMDQFLVIEYSIDSNLHSAFLKHYRESRYSSRYVFKSGKLVEYNFGFPQSR